MKKNQSHLNSSRKSPRQQRSKLLVDSILEATIRVMENIGFDSVTTNKVAEKAGVSIGSLYQYFPNKDSIFASLVDKHMEERAECIQNILDTSLDQPIERVIELIIEELVNSLYLKRTVLKTLFIQVPKLKKTQDVLYRRNKISLLLVEFFKTKKESFRSPESIEVQTYILTNAVIGTIQSAILEDFKTLTPEILKFQLTELSCQFLLKY